MYIYIYIYMYTAPASRSNSSQPRRKGSLGLCKKNKYSIPNASPLHPHCLPSTFPVHRRHRLVRQLLLRRTSQPLRRGRGRLGLLLSEAPGHVERVPWDNPPTPPKDGGSKNHRKIHGKIAGPLWFHVVSLEHDLTGLT